MCVKHTGFSHALGLQILLIFCSVLRAYKIACPGDNRAMVVNSRPLPAPWNLFWFGKWEGMKLWEIVVFLSLVREKATLQIAM